MKIEVTVVVPKNGTNEKRQQLCTAIDVALMTSGVRVTAGTWVVTLEKVEEES